MKIKYLFLLFIFTCLAGFNVSDEIELDQFISGRTSPDFRKYTKNIRTTLSKGTQGRVVDVTKPFASGNSGVKIQLTSGPRAGESYWVYFNKKQPAIKLLNKSQQEVQSPEAAAEAVTKREVAAFRDVDEQVVKETVSAVIKALQAKVSVGTSQEDLPCPALATTAATIVVEDKQVDIPESPSIGTMDSFERVEPRVNEGCSSQKHADGYAKIDIIDCKTSSVLFSGGFTFSNGPGHPYLSGMKSAYEDAGPPTRAVEFVSRDKALNETFVYLTDTAGGPDSHDVKSVMVILPRKGVPSTEVVGDDVIVTLTTGEKVVFDKKTNAIKSGAMKEGPIDLTTDRFKRTPPNVHYTGSGISIRVDHRFEYPTMGAATAEVRQGSRVCKVPKVKIWDKEGKALTSDDKSLLNIINSSCPGKGFTL